jgi:hypothetical protein
MAGNESDLPFGDAFSPAQLDTETGEYTKLAAVLELVGEHEGEEAEFKSTVAERFFEISRNPEERARLVVLGLKNQGYQLVTDDFRFTDLGERLYELRDDEDQLYREFARHILLNLHGRQVIDIIRDLKSAGQDTTADDIKDALNRYYDIRVGETSNHWSQMRGWLAEAGILNTGSPYYEINTNKLNEILGLTAEELESLEGLNDEQRAFLRGLAVIDPDGPIENTEVRTLASNIHDRDIPQGKITENILEPLAAVGYLEITSQRGSPNLIEPTEEFDAEVLEPILAQYAERTGIPREALRLNFTELKTALDNGRSSEEETALTALAVRLGRQLGLEYVGRRTDDSGTTEATTDVIMDDANLTLTRWLIHCSASRSKVTPTQIASVTTTARLTNANTILYVARSGFREDATQMAARIMQNEPYTILTLGGQPDPVYDESPTALNEALEAQLHSIRRTKEIPDDGPFRGRSFGIEKETGGDQSMVQGFDSDFERFQESESEERDLTDFTG